MTRFGWILITDFAVFGASFSAAFHHVPKFIWNVTASTPIGLYGLSSAEDLRVGDLVAISPPEPISSFLLEGGYLPKHVLLLKHVVAMRGQVVCRHGLTITVDGHALGEALERDSHDRTLPSWQGCWPLEEGELFLMNEDVRDSLDGRYFGPLSARSVIGRATPLWIEHDIHPSSEKHASDN